MPRGVLRRRRTARGCGSLFCRAGGCRVEIPRRGSASRSARPGRRRPGRVCRPGNYRPL